MAFFSKYLTIAKNKRGCYYIDPSVGCYSGMQNNPKGCYGECYAARNLWAFDFKNTVNRYFKDDNHKEYMINKILQDDEPFIRMGVNGDPSEDWDNTINICEKLGNVKPIVIITKHWNKLSLP